MQTIPAWLQQAFSDWLTRRLYLDGGGNYRLRPSRQREQRLGGLALRLGMAIEPILINRVADTLRKVCLEFDRRHRDAVQEQHQIYTVLVLLRVVDLPHYPEAVGSVAAEDVRVHA